MSAARTLVKEDGVLFIEMLNPLRYRHGAEQFSTARRLTPSIVLHSVIDVDWVHQSLNTINTIVDSSDIIGVYDEKLRFVYPSELELMAAASGFTVEILRSDWRGSPLESWSPGLAAVLRAE
ncbi:hypothetical protein AB0333_08505 [Citricoccus sp. NPDC079358]|uniref:hypothetical protein n=1 Tax=Citricoccus sp. NPDC079358 TaxID=3154653 RepID=UPI00344B65DF